MKRLKTEGFVSVEMGIPFSDLHFPTPSGKVELYSQTLAEQGLDPLPNYFPADDKGAAPPGLSIKESPPLTLLSAAAHHFTSSTFANQADLRLVSLASRSQRCCSPRCFGVTQRALASA